jgi:hypothetical protein
MKPAAAALICAFALILPRLSLAQTPGGSPDDPIGRFAFDVQGSLANLPQDAAAAAALGTTESSLPSRGLGVRIAGTFYPLRLGGVTIGLGGALAFAADSQTDEGGAFETRFVSLSPQLSLNFGRARGWSYLSGGLSRSRLVIAREGASGGEGAGTVDYGGGARWFLRERLAFSFDLRFYNLAATNAEGDVPARDRATMMVINAGISIK